jgi:ATP-dependent Clp protease ATP-binding subunit ClpC
MNGLSFNYESKRARQARLGVRLGSNNTQAMLLVASVSALVIGICLIISGASWGWFVSGLAGPLWMVRTWGKYLLHQPTSTNGTSIEELLEIEVLARVPRDCTPKQLATLLISTFGGHFYEARYMVNFDVVASASSQQPADMQQIWQDANSYREYYKLPSISSAVLALVLIQHAAGIDEYLAHVGIDHEELMNGISWFYHIEELIEEHKNASKKGGIGRDWAFGFRPLLDRFGFNISEHITYNGLLSRDLQARQQILQHTANTLSQAGRRNVVLVGQLGAGKTKLVHAFAEQLLAANPSIPKTLHYHQVIALDPSTLIAQARGRGELEQLVQHIFYEALKAKNIILFLDDAELFFEEGTGSVDITNVLLPFLDGGALRLIMAMNEQRWTRIVQNNPSLAQYMNRVMVAPANEHESMQIMQNQAVLFEYQQKVTYTYQALMAAYKLSERFMSEQVMPGKAIKLLESAASYSEQGIVTRRSVEQAIEQTQGVKVGTADTATERQTLLNLEQLIHERMINQSRAVQVVSDALRRARAGVRNTNKPIGTFLFLGPTGVGKTELAKSVAAVFFGNEQQLVRLDLNEYVRSEDVSRLIADPAQDSHSLTAQIARQPFSVVLLDEIEKAHPEVLNTLLQLLDEGILRDINNREVSFRDAVVIATSNAGADRIREHIEKGEQLEQFEKQFVDELINSNTFRPEFLNRFDEIVLFRPLEPQELLQVVDLILAGVNKNLAAQKLSVLVDDDAKQLLVESGNDPRLGARPMRRIVQRTVENIVANQLLNQQARPGEQLHITRTDIEQMLARN